MLFRTQYHRIKISYQVLQRAAPKILHLTFACLRRFWRGMRFCFLQQKPCHAKNVAQPEEGATGD